MKNLLLLLSFPFLFGSCLKDEPFKLEYAGFEPRKINDDWQVSTPENENIDRDILVRAYKLLYRDDRFTMARSLLVFRNGRLVSEAYPNNPDDIYAIYNIQSCTKSFTSILAGIAIQNNEMGQLSERLYDIYPEYFDSDVSKRGITIEDALTMRTGLEFDNSAHTAELYQTDGSSVKYILTRQKLYDPCTIMNYNDGAPHLVSKVIEAKTGKALRDYAGEKLFTPLNIYDWDWESAKDGITFGAFSLYLKPRDFGKVGQLLLQNGKWENKTIIDSAYLSEATKIHVSANYNSEPYGYYFWILPAFNGYAALGHGGQFLFVAPDKKLVVVYTAWPYTSSQFFDQRNELMNIIVNACN
ncbi:MAG: class C beta-lactamase-related serine hydrolase [Bacteroidetes bacterium]|nr:MAG: class C beta-lactamase-related serine hydrolase [Bacteroidota bacterium]